MYRIHRLAEARTGREDARLQLGQSRDRAGPYRFVEYTPGNRIVVQRNDEYWARSRWQRVTFRGIKSDPSRVAALLAGDVDLIDEVPAVDMARLKKDPKLAQTVSNRIIYLHLDHFRDDSPFVQGKDGKPIKNPLRDVRVRRAISMAIDRDAIVSRVMEGQAIKAGQLREGFFGVSPKLKPVAHDANGAKKLLAEAGVPNGFRMTIHSPNDRYPNDAEDRRSRRPDAHAHRHRDTGGDDDAGRLLPRRVHRLARQGSEVQLHPGGLGIGNRRGLSRRSSRCRHLRPREGHGRVEPRALLQSPDGQVFERGARHRG